MIDVKIQDNSLKITAEAGKAVNKALFAIGTKAVGDTVKYMSKRDFTGRDIVDSGRLRGSMSFITPEKTSGANGGEAKQSDSLSGKAEPNTVIIGTNVEYANYVNNGTKKQPARKFMEHGIEPNIDKYKEIAKKIFEGKL
jgi:HK97 gp10 family phage protein